VPMDVVDQILIIWAGSKGKVDAVPVDKVRDYEEAFLEHVNTSHADVVDAVRSAGQVTDEIADQLGSVADDFTKSFLAGLPAGVA